MMKQLQVAFLIALALFGLVPAFAQNDTTIRVYEVIAEIKGDGFVDHRVSFTIDKPERVFRHIIFSKIDNFRYESNPRSQCFTTQVVFGTQIDCDFENAPPGALVTFYFTSQDSTKKQSGVWFYQTDYKTIYNADYATVSVKLPEGALLAESAIAPYSPSDGETKSDGRRILIIWQRNNVKASESFIFSILYENVVTFPLELYQTIVISIAIVGASAFAYLYRKKKVVKQTGTHVLEVLTPEEKRVIEIIRAHGSKVIQKRVVQETDFSKAKVSRIVKNLQTRKIISVEPSGRENMLILRTGIIPETKEAPKIEQKSELKNETPDSSSSEVK